MFVNNTRQIDSPQTQESQIWWTNSILVYINPWTVLRYKYYEKNAKYEDTLNFIFWKCCLMIVKCCFDATISNRKKSPFSVWLVSCPILLELQNLQFDRFPHCEHYPTMDISISCGNLGDPM